MAIAKHECNVDGLNPVEIAKILKEKFGITVRRETMSMALSRTGIRKGYVDRVGNPRGKGYVYRIMDEGEKYLIKVKQQRL